MALTWVAATMATGVEEVDAQHRELIDHVNELFRLMQRGQGGSGLDEFVDFLADYAQQHFRYEEGCMERYRCPAAAANKAAHLQFSRTLKSYRDRLAAEGPKTALVIEIQQTVTAWIRSHIIKTDTQLNDCLGHRRACSA